MPQPQKEGFVDGRWNPDVGNLPGRAGYYVDPLDPTNEIIVDQDLGKAHGNAAIAMGEGSRWAGRDIVKQGLDKRAEGLLQGIDPSTYSGLAGEIGALNPYQQRRALSGVERAVDRQAKWATGQDSVVGRQADLEREMLARGAQSQLASARGGYNPALQRAAMMGQSQAQADLGAKAAIGRAMEQQQANQAAMAGGLGLAKGHNTLMRGQERRVGQRAGLQGVADQSATGLLGLRNQLEQQGISNYGSLLGQEYGARTPQMAPPGFGESIGNLVGSIGSLFTESDRTAKTDIGPAGGNIEQFLDAIDAYRYRYKDPQRHGTGERVGVMAQDLEKSRIGEMMVGQAPDGTKTVDIGPDKFNPLMLAVVSNLNDRLGKMEGGR